MTYSVSGCCLSLTMMSCWPDLWGWLGFWWACLGLWQSAQTLAGHCAPSPSSPTWAGATPQDNPLEREDGSPHLLLLSPTRRARSVINRRVRKRQVNVVFVLQYHHHCSWGTIYVGDSHPDWTSPSRVSLRMKSPPTSRYRNSTRHWLRWTSCRLWPLELSTWWGFSLPGDKSQHSLIHFFAHFHPQLVLSVSPEGN